MISYFAGGAAGAAGAAGAGAAGAAASGAGAASGAAGAGAASGASRMLHQEPELPALLLPEPVLLPSLHNPQKLILRKQQVMLLLD